MPLFDYKCTECEKEKELLLKEGVETLECPFCGSFSFKKQMNSGTSFVLKGSGFYKNDYRGK